MAKDPIKKAENGTYYFRANLGFHPITGKQIQKYQSGFKTKKEASNETYTYPLNTLKLGNLGDNRESLLEQSKERIITEAIM